MPKNQPFEIQKSISVLSPKQPTQSSIIKTHVNFLMNNKSELSAAELYNLLAQTQIAKFDLVEGAFKLLYVNSVVRIDWFDMTKLQNLERSRILMQQFQRKSLILMGTVEYRWTTQVKFQRTNLGRWKNKKWAMAIRRIKEPKKRVSQKMTKNEIKIKFKGTANQNGEILYTYYKDNQISDYKWFFYHHL